MCTCKLIAYPKWKLFALKTQAKSVEFSGIFYVAYDVGDLILMKHKSITISIYFT